MVERMCASVQNVNVRGSDYDDDDDVTVLRVIKFLWRRRTVFVYYARKVCANR